MTARGVSVSKLAQRGVAFHFRAHVAVALGVAVGTATLTGALLVGDSMRGSLRDLALRRIGPIDYAVIAPRFFQQQAATDLPWGPRNWPASKPACPAIILRGGVRHATNSLRVNQINVYGVEDGFWSLDPQGAARSADGQGVVLNATLAESLQAKPGDEVFLVFEKTALVPTETLLGRRDEMTHSIRLTVSAAVAEDGMGAFQPFPSPRPPRNAFVSLAVLQRALKQPGRVNSILVAGVPPLTKSNEPMVSVRAVQRLFRQQLDLADYGLKLRTDAQRGYITLESDRFLLEPPVEAVALALAESLHAAARPYLTYVVNDIAVSRESDGRSPTTGIPYSVATAINDSAGLELTGGEPAPALNEDEALLNDWAGEDLGAKTDDRLRITYYVSRPLGGLETRSATLTLRGIVRRTGLGADAGLTPTYEGVTDAKRLGDWNPPFPMDLKRVRPKDEAYWQRYKATPKLFVSLSTGLKLWGELQPRFGRLTSIRIGAAAGMDIARTALKFETELLHRLDPADFGMRVEPLRDRALAAAEGSTDFGMLFIGFSSFLIISAAMLVALLFRLGVEKRASQVGLLLAVGWPTGRVRRWLLAEGGLIAAVGAAVGTAGAVGYAWLMLAGLGTWWAGAINAPFLSLHLSGKTLLIGAVSALVIALISMAWSVRGMVRQSARQLLAGPPQSAGASYGKRSPRRAVAVSCVTGVLGLLLLAGTFVGERVPQAGAFFGGGALILVAMLAALSAGLNITRHQAILRKTSGVLVRLGVRNASRHAGRSMLTAGLIACASFVIVAVGASRQNVDSAALDKSGGTGGFALMGESVVPLAHDLNSMAGRDALNLSAAALDAMKDVRVFSLRSTTGDDTSCLNPFQARTPRLLGATAELIDRGGFTFSASLAESAQEKTSPWRLLNRRFEDGGVPCIGDANTVQWLLHLGLGKDFVMIDERGKEMRLRFVAMIAPSVLQSQLIISERDFLGHFPSTRGYNTFLVETPEATAADVEQTLERDLTNYGLDLESSPHRLAEYMAVENTYLSAFQTLGGLGLVLGSLGLAAVMLRNLVERRGELAVLRAVGWRSSSIALLVFAENAALLLAGLAAGAGSAIVAIAPHLMASPAAVPWRGLMLTLSAVLVVGLAAIAAALRPVLRMPVVAALRRE